MVLVYSKYLCTDYEDMHRGKQNMHSEQQSFVELLHIVLCFIISSSDILFYPYPFYSCHFKYDMLNFIDIWCPQCWTPNIGRFYTNVCAVITKLYTGQQTSMSLQSMKTAWDYLKDWELLGPSFVWLWDCRLVVSLQNIVRFQNSDVVCTLTAHFCTQSPTCPVFTTSIRSQSPPYREHSSFPLQRPAT